MSDQWSMLSQNSLRPGFDSSTCSIWKSWRQSGRLVGGGQHSADRERGEGLTKNFKIKKVKWGFRFATSKVFLVLKMSGTKTILSIFFQVSSMSTFNQPNKKELAHSKQQQHSGLPGTQLKKCSGNKMEHEYINSILKIATESDFLLLDSTTACCASSGLLVTKVVKCFRKKI